MFVSLKSSSQAYQRGGSRANQKDRTASGFQTRPRDNKSRLRPKDADDDAAKSPREGDVDWSASEYVGDEEGATSAGSQETDWAKTYGLVKVEQKASRSGKSKTDFTRLVKVDYGSRSRVGDWRRSR